MLKWTRKFIATRFINFRFNSEFFIFDIRNLDDNTCNYTYIVPSNKYQ